MGFSVPIRSYRRHILFQVILIIIVAACHSEKRANDSPVRQTGSSKNFALSSPAADEIFKADDPVTFEILSAGGPRADSIVIFNRGKRIHTEIKPAGPFTLLAPFKTVGRQDIRIIVYYNEGSSQTLNSRIIILSDIQPASLNYRVIRKIYHDENDYTQGLVYYKGWLYENTGQKGSSALKKKNPETGKLVMERKMNKEYFGEGITILNDKVYQLTYKHKVGFVYNVNDFELIREFDLQTMEGWGLTDDGKNLIASDGSAILYYLDPEYFNQVSQLYVSDDKGLISNLNELEYVDGTIWANVYGEPYILKIDSESGKVLGLLNLEKLFPENMVRDYEHVLNGIAYNRDMNTYFVTGKLWPVMYEIAISN